MKNFFWICCCVLFIVCQVNAKEKTISEQLQGIWEGSARQDYKGDMIEWDIRVSISPGHYTIDYPSLKCGGDLILDKEYSDSLMFKEVLKYGQEGCLNNGKTILKIAPDNKLSYYWFFSSKGKQAAFGTLNRQDYSQKQ